MGKYRYMGSQDNQKQKASQMSYYERLLKKVAERKSQDIEKGIDSYGTWLYPPIIHIVGPEDINGDPNKRGKVRIGDFDPMKVSIAELELSNIHLKSYLKFLIDRKLPQKRIRPKHDRDKSLTEVALQNINTNFGAGLYKETTKHRKMDDIVNEETEYIQDDREYAIANKRSRKKLTQAKYRYNLTSKK